MPLSETVYMKQPVGFLDKNISNDVCLLHKTLYGIKMMFVYIFSF